MKQLAEDETLPKDEFSLRTLRQFIEDSKNYLSTRFKN